MIDVALVSVIRRWHHRDQMPIREIARRTGLARNTVRRYLKSGVLEPAYPKRSSPSKLDDYESTLTTWLHRESKRSRKQRKSVKQLHRDLVAIGFTGSYDRVAAFARSWRKRQREAPTGLSRSFVPLQFAPGEAFQFDWSEDWVVIAGVRSKLQVAHFKLCYSRAFMVRAYLTQTHEMLFDAHAHCLRLLGGVADRGIYDNMKTAVDKVGRGKVRQVNRRFEAMASHYLFELEFCNPAAGWEKGQVEKSVRDTRYRIWQTAPSFKSLDELNSWLEKRCMGLWQEHDHPEDKRHTIAQMWQAERSHLMPMPQPFDGFVEHTKRVSTTCLITFERNRYSVPASHANSVVSLRVYADKLVICADGAVLCEHTRQFNRGHSSPGITTYDWRHYLAVIQRKPGALRNGAPFTQLPNAFKRLQTILLKREGGDREMVEVLALVLVHDEQDVLNAVESAIKLGNPSKQHVLNCLSRGNEPPKTSLITPPPRLKLNVEPQANLARYDALREVSNDG